ncbi:NEL-type E3 ubiquitin ligase domain-containing protein [Pseudomonas sp. RIT-To-2]|uniref:NEL-type E3 ubiquitin ligase domain-containing protein n=1 Tax=Pseudomonas sp. RIT-To-2 TaxID=3462541 RepID=UPI0024134853
MDNFAQELTPAHIVQVARLANLRFLSLRDNDSHLGRQGLLALGRLPRLQALRLGANTLAPDATLAGFPALRELDLEGCELAHWPDGLSVLMNRVPLRLQWVSMLDNPLVELPPLAHLRFFRGPRDPGMQPLDIEQGNLDNTALQRLLEADIEPHLAPPLVGGALPLQGATWRPGLDEPLRHTVDELDALPQAQDFLQALDRLATSPATARARAAMRQRIHELLRAISVPVAADIEAGLSHLRDDLFALADDALNTCGDGLELVFNRWETRVLFYRASMAVVEGPGALQPVVDMARGVLRGELLDERAMAIMRLRAQRRTALFPEAHLRAAYAHEIAELTPERSAAAPALDALDDLVDLDLAALPDEAEMRLLLRRSLATRLGLPLQPQPLLYGELASAQMIDRVAIWVEQQATPERLLDWLVHQPAWRDLLSRRSPLPFEQVREHWSSGQDYLFELGRPQPEIQPLAADVWAVIADQPPAGDQPVMPDMHLSEADQEAARQRLSTAERAAVDALVRTMTQQTL